MLAKKKYEISDINFSGNQINPIAINHTGSSATTGAIAAIADVSKRRRDWSTKSVKQKLVQVEGQHYEVQSLH
jgi:predicted carbohydrate-binding protein with CBM5 and CBM33 domain